MNIHEVKGKDTHTIYVHYPFEIWLESGLPLNIFHRKSFVLHIS